MRKSTGVGALAASLAIMAPLPAAAGPVATYDFVEYRATADEEATPDGQFRNPVLPGFHPDPSIARVGDDFYLVTSTFAYFPGLPIFHSRDLVNWNLIGHAIDRPGLVDFSGLRINRALFAPAITHRDGTFWILNTCVDCGGNFAITAKDPAGPWSDPVWLPFDGIDPSLFWDEEGHAWIVYNDAPPGVPQYDGHRALWLQQFDTQAMELVGERILLVDGGVNFDEKPIWAEGPHVYKVGEYYYLLAAEGGTADQHSQTIYRSRDVTGPYEPGPINPILTQRNMDPNRSDRVEATGHADFVELDDGSWWGTFLATRPFERQSTLLGRETYLLPVTWEDGWPLFLQPGEAVPPLVDEPALAPSAGTDWSHWRDEFEGAALDPEWIRLRGPGAIQSVGLDPDSNSLWLIGSEDAVGGLGHPAFVGRRMRHPAAEVSTRLSFELKKEGDFAGLLAFMDEDHFLSAGVEWSERGTVLTVRRRTSAEQDVAGERIASQPIAEGVDQLELRIRIDGGSAAADWRLVGSDDWQEFASDIDVEPLASVHAGLFTGVVIGPYVVAR